MQALYTTERFQSWTRYFVILASLSMYITLFLPYDGEEGTYTMSAMEMVKQGNYFHTTLYGLFYGRPPLLNWLIIPLAKLLGWQHILLASRFVTATATILTAAVVFYFVKSITKKREFAWLCTATFYGEAFLMRLGWLAYADTVMTLFTFLGMTLLWLAVEKRKVSFMLLAALAISGGFLSKALTPYFFYACAGLVLLCFHRNRWFLFHPLSLLSNCSAFLFPILFSKLTNPGYLTEMWHTLIYSERIGNHQGSEIFRVHGSVAAYLYQAFVFQPLQLVVVLLPFSAVALWCLLYRKKALITAHHQKFARDNLAIFLLGFIPCWLSWNQWPETRYYLPVLPCLSIGIAYLIDNAKPKLKAVTMVLYLVTLVVKLTAIPLGFFLRDHYLKPHYSRIAQRILQDTQPYPVIFSDIASAPNLSLAASMDSLLMPQKVLLISDNDHAPIWYLIVPACHEYPYHLPENQVFIKQYGQTKHGAYYCLFKIDNRRYTGS